MSAWLGFETLVALRFLREGRMQSVLIIVGVAAGVAVVAYISALITGLQRNTLDKTLGAQAHITISAPDDVVLPARPPTTGQWELTQIQPRAQRALSIGNWQALVPALEAVPGVVGVSPMVTGAGLAQRGEATRSVALAGVELARYERVVGLSGKVTQGRLRLEPGDAVIGSELATDLGVRVGDRLSVSTTVLTESLRVTAIVDLGVRELNRRSVIVPLRTGQALVGLTGGATSVDLTLDDVWAAQAIAANLSARWPYKVESWQQTNAQLVSALNAQSVSTTLIRVIVLAVVVLGIASVLVVSVVQKRREIGILRAMGATREQIMRVFLLQGAVVGTLGSALGIVLAVLLIKAFTTFVRGSDGQPLFAITLEAGTAWQVAAIATVCGIVAAVGPARRAAALDPAQAIRM